MTYKTKSKAQAPRREQTCESAVTLIGDYLTGNLGSDIQSALDHHLRQCRDCEAFLNTYRKTVELTQRFLSRQTAGPVGQIQLANRSGWTREKVIRRKTK